MMISLVNLLTSGIDDTWVQHVIRAINRQVAEDFAPHWHWTARVRLEGPHGKLNLKTLRELRGDAIIYLAKNSDDREVRDAVGYHATDLRGVPYGVVFCDVAAALKEPWSATLSHEVLELVGDANNNTFAAGPHPDPKQKGRTVLHWYEMCDAVQAETYEIDDVVVSNFVLPLYFTPNDEVGSRNDFLGTTRSDGTRLRSFGVNPGGYVGYLDPVDNSHATYEADAAANKRHKIKAKFSGTMRRAMRRPLP